ncbi:MAG: hypothetical protein A3K19_10980 [Lentisphaerae bacterium RIFOXYB12_FULL_65_16]|nr:MAG: hypothetical protein A3K18_17290 [Lentisphaerae bacterium RIFOXYA12_64_32]OGV87108.1 MAG: hypothetical protein A3K19_10980 [Lentisphaerae bacterium RIFOXYB12_FULL_65_16]
MLERFRQRIQEKAAQPNTASVVIVAIGDSVTMGAMELGRFDFDGVYHQRLKRLLEQRYPATAFSVINSGVNGDSAAGGLARIDRDVIRYQPDLVLIAFGLNDSGGGLAGAVRFRETLSEIIRRVRQGTPADIIVLTPSFMNTRDSAKVAPEHRQHVEDFIRRQTTGVLAAYAEAIRETARQAGLPLADVYAAWEQLAARGVDTTALLANGLNHPTREAHRIQAELILQLIDPAFKPSALTDLAKRG